jgi:integrase
MLEAKRSPKWLHDVKLIGNALLLPEFGKRPLSDLSDSPTVVRYFHARVTKENGPTQASRAMAILCAAYRLAAKLNRSVPAALPTSGVNWNKEESRQVEIDWKAWRKAREEISSLVRRSFHLVGLLTGMRPGELAGARLDARRRELVVAKAKAGADIRIPLSLEIVKALELSRGEVWSSARRNATRDKLPVYGHGLRHVYATVAKSIGVDPLILKLLMGHTVSDVTEAYVGRPTLRPSLRQAQQRISAEIVKWLGIQL